MWAFKHRVCRESGITHHRAESIDAALLHQSDVTEPPRINDYEHPSAGEVTLSTLVDSQSSSCRERD